MGDFNFKPAFNPSVASELDNRKSYMRNKSVEWNYRKYAYFSIESLASTVDVNSTDSDYLSVFSLRPKGGLKIGTASQNGYLSAFHDSQSDITTLKPVLSSATISSNGGGDIYDAYISEVNVSFKVYTLSQLNEVERELFSLGAKVKVKYGWLGSSSPGILDGELIINIYNFGFTMSSDGSFDCNIKGLTEGVFVESQTIADTIKLTQTEQDALGKNAANPATLPQSLLAKAFESAGITGGDANSRDWSDYVPFFGDSGINALDKGGDIIKFTKNSYTYYFALWHELVGEEIKKVTIPYISFGELIDYINKTTKSAQFEFIGQTNLTDISKPKNLTAFGSADPRKFIFPGDMGVYNDSTYTPTQPPLPNTIPTDYKIQNILISLNLITEYYEQLSKKTKNEKVIPPSLSALIKKISSEISTLSGGLVDIKTVPKQNGDNVEFENVFQIFNNQMVQKDEKPQSPYEFQVLSKDSIVKDISIDTDFDVDTMTMMSIGRVKKGEFNIEPLKSVYDDLTAIPVNQEEVASDVKNKTSDEISKTTIAKDGIDGTKVTSIADSMRKALVSDTDTGTFISLPFYIKLGITIDGINGIGFLQPITVKDRIPAKYTQAGVKFLITSIEHTFDGQGGWETKLDSAMKLGL